MSKADITGASSKKPKAKGCKWKGCKKKHYDEEIEYENEDKGDVERGKYVGPWHEPYNIQLDSYTKHGVKKGKFVKLKSTRTMYLDIKDSDVTHYSTQNHHVIPVDSISSFSSLKHNLKLMGWNLNDGLSNGICLPYFKEDYIWHNLQPHRGSHPLVYTNLVKKSIKPIDKACKKFCTDAENKLSAKDQNTLTIKINAAVTKVRNKILNWDAIIHRQVTLDKWTSAVQGGKSTGGYRLNNKPTKVPELSKPSGRKYFEID